MLRKKPTKWQRTFPRDLLGLVFSFLSPRSPALVVCRLWSRTREFGPVPLDLDAHVDVEFPEEPVQVPLDLMSRANIPELVSLLTKNPATHRAVVRLLLKRVWHDPDAGRQIRLAGAIPALISLLRTGKDLTFDLARLLQSCGRVSGYRFGPEVEEFLRLPWHLQDRWECVVGAPALLPLLLSDNWHERDDAGLALKMLSGQDRLLKTADAIHHILAALARADGPYFSLLKVVQRLWEQSPMVITRFLVKQRGVNVLLSLLFRSDVSDTDKLEAGAVLTAIFNQSEPAGWRAVLSALPELVTIRPYYLHDLICKLVFGKHSREATSAIGSCRNIVAFLLDDIRTSTLLDFTNAGRVQMTTQIIWSCLESHTKATAKAVVEEDGVRVLIAFLRRHREHLGHRFFANAARDSRLRIVWSLYYLADSHGPLLLERNASRELIHLMRTCSVQATVIGGAAWTLYRMARQPADLRLIEQEPFLVEALLRVANDLGADEDSRCGAACSLFRLAEHGLARLVDQAIDTLVQNFKSSGGKPEGKKYRAAVLRKIATRDPRTAARVIRAGGALAWAMP